MTLDYFEAGTSMAPLRPSRTELRYTTLAAELMHEKPELLGTVSTHGLEGLCAFSNAKMIVELVRKERRDRNGCADETAELALTRAVVMHEMLRSELTDRKIGENRQQLPRGVISIAPEAAVPEAEEFQSITEYVARIALSTEELRWIAQRVA